MSKYLLLILSLWTWRTNAQVKSDDVTGTWLTHGDKPAKVNIFRATDNKYYGKIVWLQIPVMDGKPAYDKFNPDTAKRSRPLMGLQLLRAFKFDTDDWTDGYIYDPESGKTYSCTMTLKDANTLKVRGYIGISLIGRTEIWTRTQ
jgi:uncharacterized protein (DUF2147 family)